MVIVSKIIQVILPLGKVGKNKSFPEGPNAFALLVTRHEGKHYPNSVLELPFLLVVSWCWWPGPSLRHKKGYWKMFIQIFGKTNWRCGSVSLKAAGFSGKCCRQVWPPAHDIFFPLIKQNYQSKKGFPANHFPQKKKVKLMNLGKENSVLATQNLSYLWGSFCFSLPDWTVIIHPISQYWLH